MKYIVIRGAKDDVDTLINLEQIAYIRRRQNTVEMWTTSGTKLDMTNDEVKEVVEKIIEMVS